MSYLLKTNRGRPRGKIIAILVILVLVLLFSSLLQRFFSPLTHRLLDPLLKAANVLVLKSSKTFLFLEPKRQLIEENDYLRNELLRRGQELLDYQIIKRENEILKGIERNATTSTIIAGVIRTPDQSPYDTLIIEAGKNRGLAIGDKVTSITGIPLGAVLYVYKDSSLVKLYSSPGETHNVYIGIEKIAGRATGRGGGNFEIILPHGAKVEIGDAIILPGIYSQTFGVVESVAETQGGTFIRILFKNPLSFSELRLISVETNT